MSKQDARKIQRSCVLRVNIHCDGCKHKVEKKLRKIEGVYKVSTDVEKGEVTVSGNVDPITLIEKLEKAGKHAELWGIQKPPISIMNNQFNDIQFEKGNGGKDSRGRKGGSQAHYQGNMKKELKDMKFPGKDRKTVKFELAEEDSGFDDDEEEGGFEYDSDEEFSPQKMPSKVAPFAGNVGNFSQGIKPASDSHLKAKSSKDGKKASRFDMFVKSMLGKTNVGGKKGSAESYPKKGGNQKKGGKDTWFVPGEDKNASKCGKVDRGRKTKEDWGKKHDENIELFPKMKNKLAGMDNVNANPRLGGGRIGSQPANFQAVHGLPAGNFQGMGPGNPYNQQQYMQQIIMMNQQHGNGHPGQGGYHHPSASYMQPIMNYGPPPPPTDTYTHIFSDENTDSCSVM